MTKHYIISTSNKQFVIHEDDLADLMRISKRAREVGYTSDYRGKRFVANGDPLIDSIQLEEVVENEIETALPSPRPSF